MFLHLFMYPALPETLYVVLNVTNTGSAGRPSRLASCHSTTPI